MSAQPTTAPMTVEEFLLIPSDGMRHELWEGVLHTMPPSGSVHGLVTARVIAALGAFVEPRSLGLVFPESGVRLVSLERTVLAPDASFVAAERLPPRTEWDPWVRLAPDLAVEVLSPGDRAGAVARKTALWLAGGVRLLWNVDPRARRATVHAAGLPPHSLGVDDELDGGDVLPGFRLPLAGLFD